MKYFLFIFLLLFSGFAEARGKGGAYSQSVLVSSKIGVAISGLESATPGVPCPSTTGVDVECQAYASNGYAYWRLTFAWEQLQPTLGGSFNSTYQGYITNVIRQGGLLGVKVILDCHNFGRYNGVAIGAASGPTYAQFANLWSRLATVVQGTAGLGGYELMNEPYSMPSYQTVPLMYQAAVTAIRAVDTATAIYMDGDAYASAYGWNGNCSNCGGAPVGGWGAGGNAQLLTVTDPNNNLVFVAHAYADYDGSGTYPVYPASVAVVAGCTAANDTYACAQLMGDQLTSPTSTLDTNILVKRMTPFVTFCTSNNVSCAVTETGVPPDDQNWLTALNLQLAYLQTNNVLFTYWAAGVYSACANYPSSCGYPLGIEPTNGENTVQVAVLTKYSGAAQPTNYYLSGPQRGTSGVASSNFTVTYRGYVSSAFSVIPNDGGAGGTFTPSVVVCGGPSFNCSASFTYTAPGSSVYAISTTNTKGLTDPSAIGYATVADEFSTAGLSSSQIVNVFSMRKIYAPYIGNAVTLRRSSDNTTASFGFTSIALGSPLNTSAITTWLNGSTGYVVTWYDQSPNQNNATIITADGGQSPSTTDQPPIILSCQNGQPCLNFTGSNRMDFISPIDGNTQQTILSVYSPQYHWGSGNFMGWDWAGQVAFDFWPSGSQNSINDQWHIQGTPYGNGVREYSMDSTWNAIGGTWTQANATVGMRTFLNGALTDQGPTGPVASFTATFSGTTMTVSGLSGSVGIQPYMPITGSGIPAGTYVTALGTGGGGNGTYTVSQSLTISTPETVTSTGMFLPYSRSNATLGYQRFGGANFIGQLGELVVLNTALTDSSTISFHADEDSYWGIPSMASYSWPTATLQQNIGSANAPPWDGVNETGAVGQFGKNTNFTTPPAGLAYYATRGFNISRVPVQWEQLQQNLCTGSTTLDSTSLTQLETYVTQIEATGQDVLIDLHNYGGYNYSYWSTCASPPDNGAISNATTQSYFVNFWTQLAAIYKNDPKVKFDLMNEPVGVTDAQMAVAGQAAITAIRGQSFNNYIFWEPSTGYAACASVSTTSGASFLTLTDSQNKLVLECHMYLQSCGNDQCGDYAVQGKAASVFNPLTTWATTNSVHVFWGEFNPGFTASMYTEMKVAMDIFNANPSVYYGWTVYQAGPANSEGYPGLVEPRDFTQPYSDRAQMKFLNYYATGHTWPCSVYASGSSGPCATANWPLDVKFP